MADAVTTQVLFNGPRHLVVKLTDVSDGTGMAGVTLVDAQSATYAVNVQGNAEVPGVHLKLTRLQYDCAGMKVKLLWDAGTDDTMLVLGGFGTLDFTGIGGLQNPLSSGATGSVLVSTIGAAANTTATLVAWFTKGVPNAGGNGG